MKTSPSDSMPLTDRQAVDYELLYLLEQEPGLSQRELSKRLGISLGKANYCLRALADKGWVKLETFRQSSDKAGYVHVLTARGIAQRSALASIFLKRKRAEYERLKSQLALLENDLSGNAAANRAPLSKDAYKAGYE